MSETAIRAQIKSILEGVASVGVVHDRYRFSRSYASWLELLRDGDTVNGWMIHRSGAMSDRQATKRVERTHRYVIFGVHDLGDTDDTDATFQGIVEDIYAAFIDNATLNGAAKWSGPPQVDSVDWEDYGGTLYHVAELSLNVIEETSYLT